VTPWRRLVDRFHETYHFRPRALASGSLSRSSRGKGYMTILTDTGHVGDGASAKWTRLPDNRPDTVKITDSSIEPRTTSPSPEKPSPRPTTPRLSSTPISTAARPADAWR
jgi:hypothetical protein